MNIVTISTDRAWFKKNPSRNTRLRLPGKGEVEAIMRHSLCSTAPMGRARVTMNRF
jgi:hypothetical protein